MHKIIFWFLYLLYLCQISLHHFLSRSIITFCDLDISWHTFCILIVAYQFGGMLGNFAFTLLCLYDATFFLCTLKDLHSLCLTFCSLMIKGTWEITAQEMSRLKFGFLPQVCISIYKDSQDIPNSVKCSQDFDESCWWILLETMMQISTSHYTIWPGILLRWWYGFGIYRNERLLSFKGHITISTMVIMENGLRSSLIHALEMGLEEISLIINYILSEEGRYKQSGQGVDVTSLSSYIQGLAKCSGSMCQNTVTQWWC